MFFDIFDLWKTVLRSLRRKIPFGREKYLKPSPIPTTWLKPPDFKSKEQVRILLFRECNGQDRHLLFDSRAVKKKNDYCSSGKNQKLRDLPNRRSKESSIEKSFKLNNSEDKELIYESRKPSSDDQMLREMIFGSVSISYQGTTTKVHTIRSPPKVMISVVFPAPPFVEFRIGDRDLDESGNWNNSTSDIEIPQNMGCSESYLAHSVPINATSRSIGHYEEVSDIGSGSFGTSDGFSSLPSSHLSQEKKTSSLPRSGSYNSLQRRLLRNKATSIELGLHHHPEDGQVQEYARNSGQKRVKLGLSVVISLNEAQKDETRQFKDFFFTHITLIESQVMILKETVVKAYLNRMNFVLLMHEGSKKFQLAIQSLYTAPRLISPEWLTIISSTDHHHLSCMFIQKFVWLLKEYDKKETNFFVSTLLTAVLTHHLSWVPTVIPTDAKLSSTSNNSSHKHMPHWVDILAKARPYNPLWVQLGDLYGALGYPLKLTKTLVTGKKADIILQFLQILSYFLRCSDICEQAFEKVDIDYEKDLTQNGKEHGSHSCDLAINKLNIKSVSHSVSKNCNSSLNNQSFNSSHTLCGTLSHEVDSHSAKCETSCCNPNSFENINRFVSSSPQCLEVKSSYSIYNEHSDLFQSKTVTSSNVLCEHTCELQNNVNDKSCLDSLGYESMEEKLLEDNSGDMCFQFKAKSLLHEKLIPKIEVDGIINTSSISEIIGDAHFNCGAPCDTKTDFSNFKSPFHLKDINSVLGKCKCEKHCKLNMYSLNGTQSTSVCEFLHKKQCGTVEDGYHSIEEPHTPRQGKMNFTEMLKQYDAWAPEGLVELPLSQSRFCHSNEEPKANKSFGWSLMAGVCDHYVTDFCLQGVLNSVSDEEIRKDLITSTKVPVLGEPIEEAVCVVASTDNWSVQLLSSKWNEGDRIGFCGVRVGMSSLMGNICESILHLHELGVVPESCVIHLEDRLQELYFRSQTLSDYLSSNKNPTALAKVTNALNIDTSDIPLLLSIASTHSPYLTVLNR